MKVLYRCCAGLDVHKTFVIVCLLLDQENGQTNREIRRFTTMTADLLRMIDWLKEKSCTHLAMESSGVDWKPIYNLLEGAFEVLVVNAQHRKAVPGHKTDIKDAEWIADLLQHGLLKASFIPPQEQRDLRDLTRYRTTLLQERSRLANRLQKVLEDANLKLASVISDVLGQTGRLILRALARGENDEEKLADLALPRLAHKRAAIAQSLQGRFRPHHRFLHGELLDTIEYHDRAIGRLDAQIEEHMHPFEETIQRLDEITGVGPGCLQVLFAEVGSTVKPFPDGPHLASWLGLCPGNHESGGKRLSGRIRQGNRYVKAALIQAAHAAGRTKNTDLGAQYRRLRQRLGTKRAAVAVAHSMVLIYYQMLATGETYQEKGVDYFLKRDQQQVERRLIKQLEHLGHKVILLPVEQTSA